MTKEEAEFIAEALNEAGEEYDLREGYCGRSMYGKETFGIVVSDIGSVIKAVAEHAHDLGMSGEDIPPMSRYRLDAMATDTIIY